MADKKITQLTNITGADLANSDEFVVVDITADETKAITFDELKTAFDTGTGFVRITGDTMTGALNVESTITSDGMIVDGNVTFGDNDKAIFGAGSDLQIYHDGSNSYISEEGTGSLAIRAENLVLQNSDSSKNYGQGINGGAFEINYNGVKKLATTSTGIDVTGTVTSDGLTVSGVLPRLFLDNTGDGIGEVEAVGLTSTDLRFGYAQDNLVFRSGSAERMRIDSSGNVGIGTSSPIDTLHCIGSDGTTGRTAYQGATEFIFENNGGFSLDLSSGNSDSVYINWHDTDAVQQGYINYDHNGDFMRLATNGTERMRIDSSGNVGIGTSSPSATLDVVGTVVTDGLSVDTTSPFMSFKESGATKLFIGESSVVGGGGAGYYDFYAVTGLGQRFFTNSVERMRITSSGNVGIGTSAPASPTGFGSSGILHLKAGTGNDCSIVLEGLSGSGGRQEIGASGGALQFYRGAATGSMSESMRITSSGNLLVGVTGGNTQILTSGGGTSISSVGGLASAYQSINANDPVLALNNTGVDGSIIGLRKDGSAVGSIGTTSNAFFLSSSRNELNLGSRGATQAYMDVIGGVALSTSTSYDGSSDLGRSNARFDDIYATNGTIQTSDFNEKQDIASLTATEMLVGKRISELFKTFRWKDSVAEKGDNARTHTGVIAQDVQAAFTAEGLDAGDYALFISSTWWEHDVDVPAVEAVAEVTDEDGNVTTEAVEAEDAYTRTDNYDTEAEAPEGATERTRLGIRYPELLSFVAAYNEQRFASIEARLTALEG